MLREHLAELTPINYVKVILFYALHSESKEPYFEMTMNQMNPYM